MQHTKVLFVTFFLLFLLVAAGCKDEGEHLSKTTDTLPAAAVTLQQAEEVQIADQVEIMGTVEAALKAVISSRISGTITKINVIPGSRVKKGDVLIQINAGEINAQLLQAKATLDQATRNLTREQKLLAKKATTPEAVKELEDVHKIAQADFEEAQIMLDYTTIVAPFDGRITKKLVDVGELASSGTALLNLESEDRLQVETDVPETIAQHLQLKMQMHISVPAAGVETTGVVSEVAPAADSTTRTIPIKLDINKLEGLHSGQFARVTLPGEEVKTLIIPANSVVTRGQLTAVFVADGERAKLRLIRTGKTYSEGIEVLSGLNPGDHIVTAGADSIRDGQKITYEK